MIPRHKRMDFAAYVALAASVIFIWCREYRVGGEQKLSMPIEYWGDALATQGTLRATSEFSYLPFVGKSIARLGAPYVARWDDYPVTEDLIFFFWGMVARVTGVFAAANIAYVTAGVLAAWSLYFVARHLRARRTIAFSPRAGLRPLARALLAQHPSLRPQLLLDGAALCAPRLEARLALGHPLRHELVPLGARHRRIRRNRQSVLRQLLAPARHHRDDPRAPRSSASVAAPPATPRRDRGRSSGASSS